MTRVQRLEREIEELAPSELAAFRKWFQDYDAAQWDKQIEEDAATGKFDRLAQRALADHKPILHCILKKSGNTGRFV